MSLREIFLVLIKWAGKPRRARRTRRGKRNFCLRDQRAARLQDALCTAGEDSCDGANTRCGSDELPGCALHSRREIGHWRIRSRRGNHGGTFVPWTPVERISRAEERDLGTLKRR